MVYMASKPGRRLCAFTADEGGVVFQCKKSTQQAINFGSATPDAKISENTDNNDIDIKLPGKARFLRRSTTIPESAGVTVESNFVVISILKCCQSPVSC